MATALCDQGISGEYCSAPATRLLRYDFGHHEGPGAARPTCAEHYKRALDLAARFAAKGESSRYSIVSDEPA